MAIAVILAGGKGARMEAPVNKVLLKVKGKTILEHTLQCFEKSPCVKEMILVIAKKNLPEAVTLRQNFPKLKVIIEGGKERFDSVENGLRWIKQTHPDYQGVVVLSNAANPLVTSQEIATTIAAAEDCGAAVVGRKCVNTIKQAKDVDGETMVVKTINRSDLYEVQTPQAAKFGLLLVGLEHAKKNGITVTDDVSLIELMAGPVRIVPASDWNFKITTPKDLRILEAFLAD